MQSSIVIHCFVCQARIKAPVQLIGRRRDCPGCGQPLLIQRKPPTDAGPLMLSDGVADLSLSRTAATEKLILLVDDDRELNDGLRSLLEKQGRRVIQAFDGVEAKELADRQRPDLIILDMMMPKLGGYPVLEHFHKNSEAPPIIMMTAKEGAEHKLYAEYLGVVDYLNKPFAIDHFLKSVEKGLEQGEREVSRGGSE